jgi:hypothetical protein
MTSTVTNKPPSIQYPLVTVKRAERALRCSPFQLTLFSTMINKSVPLGAITLKTGQNQGYTKQPITEVRAERELMWLIKVGVLRREVDGQGITDSFRLTPLGREIVSKWEKLGRNLPPASGGEHLVHKISRWFSWQL